MPKGIYSQAMCVLTTQDISIKKIGAALESFNVIGYPKTDPEQKWQFGGPSLVAEFDEDSNGKVAVDVVGRTWPDGMGDPKKAPITFGAWSMGQFGPFTFPGGLQRAGEHSWDWAPGKTIAEKHTGFIRLRSSYAFGADNDAPILPENYDSLEELVLLTNMVDALLELPGTLCYYNPSGEVLRDRGALVGMIEFCETHNLIPVPLWCNCRFFNLPDGWNMMDTVGNGQLDIPDFEIVFKTDKHDPAQIDGYLRNVTLHLFNNPDVEFKDGDKIDGPNETNLTWRIRIPEGSICAPPRPLMRLCPRSDKAELQKLLGEKW